MLVDPVAISRPDNVDNDPVATVKKASAAEPMHLVKPFSTRLTGVLTRKERWGLSRRGWLLVGSIAVVVSYLVFSNARPFLAVTHRVDSKILVVEGWIQGYAMRKAADEFNHGSYERIYTTGGPENGSGGYVNDYQTSAGVAADVLEKAGIPEEVIQMAPSHVTGRERTYGSAVALRDWFRGHNLTIQSLNVLTEDCHARRTQLLYQEAFGRKVAIGIISVSNPDYNPKDWWRYSDGVREVIGESIAYIYARFLFWPPKSTDVEKAPQTTQTDTTQ